LRRLSPVVAGVIRQGVEEGDFHVTSPEAAEPRPLSPYGMSKVAGEGYCALYGRLHRLEAVSLRLGNVYGPRQDPHGEAGVVSIFAGKLLDGDPCTIFGNGEQTRDFVFVDDVVDAFVRAMTRGGGLLFNIGTGIEVSVNELYASMAKAAEVSAPAVYAPARVGELDRIALDASKAKLHLEWDAWTDIDAGTRAVIDWAAAARST